MAKMKIFEFLPKNAEAISDLLRSVRILENGFFISDGHFGIMYREADDVGMEADNMVNPISAEVSKHQKQVLIQEGLIRANSILEKQEEERQKKYKADADEAGKNFDKHGELKTFVPLTLSVEIEKKKARLSELTKIFSRKGKDKVPMSDDEREKLLKEAQALDAELKTLTAEADKKQAEYNAETKRLKEIIGNAVTSMTEASKRVKEYREAREAAEYDKAEAMVFLEASMSLVKDIQKASFNKETGLLEFKK